ncbi:hypothetical protein ACFOZ0_22250 [Streptomyces yaanensis]|uniref:Transposase n=1 Tax=Streptomyces yaanensis TaxID=1142239 RepID=A0ABV7SH50_9ACTN|nr:hypothetical protein [Streptomyces sp. CGMCC 4.7035]WNB97452.1 hypothetical protein Q2K21_04840 [Streptomyces sp. CGMCC 4.7035]
MTPATRTALRPTRQPQRTAVENQWPPEPADPTLSDCLPAPVVARLLDDEESNVRTAMALHARDQIDPTTAERIDRNYRPRKKTRWRPADDFPDHTERPAWKSWPMSEGVLVCPRAWRSATTSSRKRWVS